MRANILVATVLAAALVSVPLGAADGATVCSSLEIQAHRGYHTGRIDQNTVKAFDEAHARGYTIETDVWSDAEGQLWVYHDRDVSKLSTGTGFIDELTTEEVAALRYKAFGSPLPTFEEAVAAWSKYPTTRVYIEPKQSKIIPEMARQLKAAGLVDNIYFSGYWDYVERYFPEFPTQPKSSDYYAPSRWSKNDAVMTKWQSMTVARVAEYHAAGLEVLHFRSNKEYAWEQAIQLNFDGIMTDRPDDLRAFCPTVQ